MTDKMQGAADFRAAMNGGDMDAWLECYTDAEIRAHIRTYAAQVARQMVPDGSIDRGFNACRAATLSAIDEWEKNNG